MPRPIPRESQQAMAILKAGELEESTHGATTQKLITSLNRGGLWSITMPAQIIFVKIEKHFRLLTPNSVGIAPKASLFLIIFWNGLQKQ